MSYLFDELSAKDKSVPIEDKILIMGLSEAGKTAIKDVVFFDKDPDDVEDYMATVHYERQFLDEEKKSLIIDSGGQESYWNEAVTHFRHLVFSDVKLLLWIVDMTQPNQFEESERRFSFTIRQFKKENPDGHIAVLCHKIDRIELEELVPLLERVEKEFNDPKFKVRFEASSIYYKDSLKDLITELMKNANLNVKRFELITNIGQKVEESEEFQSFVVDNRDDPRIKQLMDYLNPDPDRNLPTYGSTSIAFDLSAYNIIEIVLIDKESFTPITGTSSKNIVDIEETMDYIVALQEFKDAVKNRGSDDSTFSIVTSSNEKVHALIVDLVSRYLLITSFVPITKEKTQAFYELISKFASTVNSTLQTGAPIEVEQVIDTRKPDPMIEVISVVAPAKPIVEASKKETEMEEKSVFSFLNKLMKEDYEEELSEPAIVETPIVESKDVLAPDVVSIIKEIDEEQSTELGIKEQETKEVPVVESLPEPEAEKPKSRFVQRLREEGRKYLIRKVEIQKTKEKEALEMSEEKLKNMAQFLVDANKADVKDDSE